MLSILSGILGFATSGLPSVLKFFEQKGDQKHEQSMARLEIDRTIEMAKAGYASQERIEEFKTDQVEMKTYAEERVALYKHGVSEILNGFRYTLPIWYKIKE